MPTIERWARVDKSLSLVAVEDLSGAHDYSPVLADNGRAVSNVTAWYPGGTNGHCSVYEVGEGGSCILVSNHYIIETYSIGGYMYVDHGNPDHAGRIETVSKEISDERLSVNVANTTFCFFNGESIVVEDRDNTYLTYAWWWVEIDQVSYQEFTNVSDSVNFNDFSQNRNLFWKGTAHESGGGDDHVILPSEGNAGKILNEAGAPVFSLAGLHFRAGGGDDQIDGSHVRKTDIRISTGSGEDSIRGGWRHDTLRGGDDDDTLSGHRGNDLVAGGEGRDRLFGNRGHDVLNGGDKWDTLTGGRGRDTLIGGDYADRLRGGDGDDVLFAGDDTLLVDPGETTGWNMLDGGRGDDTLRSWTSDTVQGDRLTGGSGRDVFWVNNEDRITDAERGDTIHMLNGGTNERVLLINEGGQASLRFFDGSNELLGAIRLDHRLEAAELRVSGAGGYAVIRIAREREAGEARQGEAGGVFADRVEELRWDLRIHRFCRRENVQGSDNL